MGHNDKPTVIYYRWVYSPSTGDVTLSHNHEAGPADIRFHSEMLQERPEKDLECGYAYRQDGDWKVSNEDHKDVKDAHIASAVNQAIRKVHRHNV